MYIINVVKKKLLYTCTCTRRVHSSKWSFILFFLAVPGVFGPTLAFLTGLKKKKNYFMYFHIIEIIYVFRYTLYILVYVHISYTHIHLHVRETISIKHFLNINIQNAVLTN